MSKKNQVIELTAFALIATVLMWLITGPHEINWAHDFYTYLSSASAKHFDPSGQSSSLPLSFPRKVLDASHDAL